MITKYKILVICLFSILLAGCEKVISFSEDEIRPMLVVNCVVTPDSSVKVDLTRSLSLLEESSIFPVVKNAKLTLSDGLSTYSDFSYITDNDSALQYYDSNGPVYVVSQNSYYENKQLKVTPGQTLSLSVSAEGFASVSATTEIPVPIPITQIDTFSIRETNQYEDFIKSKLKLSFSDPEQTNYYRLKIEKAELNVYYNSETSEISYNPNFGMVYFDTNDPVFGQDNESDILDISGSGNSYNTFNDQLFNGKEYTIELTYNNEYNYNDGYYYGSYYTFSVYRIQLISLSESYYYYLQTAGSQIGSGLDLFADPVLIYTNIENGTGIMGACTTSDSYIAKGNLPDEVKEIISGYSNIKLFQKLKADYEEMIKSGNYGDYKF